CDVESATGAVLKQHILRSHAVFDPQAKPEACHRRALMSRCPRLQHGLLAATAIAFGCVAPAPAAASAAPLLVLGQDGRARWRDDPFLRGPADTPVPDAGRLRHTPKRAGVARSRGRTVRSELVRLLRTHQ